MYEWIISYSQIGFWSVKLLDYINLNWQPIPKKKEAFIGMGWLIRKCNESEAKIFTFTRPNMEELVQYIGSYHTLLFMFCISG